MFKATDRVKTVRNIRAGLSEDGPQVCESNTIGTVLVIERNEPDGILVRLTNGVEWWFKPNQLEIVNE